MNNTYCTFEREVLKAVKSNQWTNDVRNHAASCSLCKETIAMTTLMQKISREDVLHALPSYRLIWLKAQYARRQERLSALDMVALIGMSLTGIAGFVGLLFWRFPQLFDGAVNVTGTSAVNWTGMVSHGVPIAVIVGAIVTVWLLTRDSFFAERW